MKLLTVALRWMERLKALFRRDEGQGLLEYGLVLALITIVVVTAVSTLGIYMSDGMDEVTAGINAR